MSGVLFVSEARLSGYGVAGREYLRALHRAGVPVRWLPLVPGRWRGLPLRPDPAARVPDDPELDALVRARVDPDRVVVHAVPEYFAPVFAEHARGRRRVGVTVWETDRLPRAWPALLERGVDRLVVPTAWNLEVFRADLPRLDVRVAPHILEDAPPASPGARPPREGVVFYTVGEWVDRKNLVGTIAAFLRAFRARDGVRLVVKTGDRDLARRGSAPGLVARAARRVRSAAARRGLAPLAETMAPVRRLRASWEEPPPVEVHPEPWPRARVQALHTRGDCFFSLTHGEGWGLGAFEAAAAGNDVVTTAFGGPLAWLPPGCAGLVPQRLVPVESVMGSYTADQRWAEPDVDAAVARLRAVAADPAAARARGEALRAHVRARFGHAEAGPAFVRAVMDDAA